MRHFENYVKIANIEVTKGVRPAGDDLYLKLLQIMLVKDININSNISEEEKEKYNYIISP